MKQVRIGVFETNSSSTHSICISAVRNDPLQYPSHIIFKCGEFGWREARLDTPEEKASYLYSSMICLFEKDELESSKAKILDHLAKEGITCEFEQPIYEYGGLICTADIDHAGADDHQTFIRKTIRHQKRLLRYLFSEKSFVLTGNDNDDTAVNISADYPHEEYYKGN